MLVLNVAGVRLAGRASKVHAARSMFRPRWPDVLILDPLMEEESGLDLIAEAINQPAKCRVVIAADYRMDRQQLRRAVRAGAAGAFHIMDSEHMVAEGMLAIMENRRHFSPHLSACLVDEDAPPPRDNLDHLSTKERQVFALLGQTLSIKEIAGEASMSNKTVETHQSHLKQKLGIRTNAELRRKAILHAGGKT